MTSDERAAEQHALAEHRAATKSDTWPESCAFEAGFRAGLAHVRASLPNHWHRIADERSAEIVRLRERVAALELALDAARDMLEAWGDESVDHGDVVDNKALRLTARLRDLDRAKVDAAEEDVERAIDRRVTAATGQTHKMLALADVRAEIARIARKADWVLEKSGSRKSGPDTEMLEHLRSVCSALIAAAAESDATQVSSSRPKE